MWMRFSFVFVSLIAGFGAMASSKPFQEQDDKTPAILHQKIKGVELRLNQVQLQRLGADASLAKVFQVTGFDRDDFQRTIAISISQKGQGTTVGPTWLELKNGEKIRPFINGNQKLMSGVVNADVPEGFDFAEYWFQIPKDTKLSDIFPVTLSHKVTNQKEETVSFRLHGIEP